LPLFSPSPAGSLNLDQALVELPKGALQTVGEEEEEQA
jgi:hypothetical protein